MTIKEMGNVGVVIADLDEAVTFFLAPGMELDGHAQIEGTWGRSGSGPVGNSK